MFQKWKGQKGIPLQDFRILDRIQKCLDESNDRNIEFGQIIRHLHTKYPEYRRRKQASFRELAKQALRIINPDTKQPSYKETSLPLTNVVPITPKRYIMNNFLNNMYNNLNTPQSLTNNIGDEIISICSDESDQSSEQISLISSQLSSDCELQSEESSDKSSSKSSVVNGNKRTHNETTETSAGNKRLMNSSTDSDSDVSDSNEQNDQRATGETTNEQTVRTFKNKIELETSTLTFSHLGGIEKLLKDLCEILIHIKSPEMYVNLGVSPPQGILIYGTTGSGKTLLAYAIAGQLKIPIINVPLTEMITGVTGESEEHVRDIFEQAALSSPCVLFLDDIDAIATNHLNANIAMEVRIVSQLISCMDNLKMSRNGRKVLVIGATTSPDVLDPALRRCGRFDHEIALPIPDRHGRTEILRIICDGLSLEPDLNLDRIAELTPGYVGADISALVSRAALFAANRKFIEQISTDEGEHYLEEEDLSISPRIITIDSDSENEVEMSTISSIETPTLAQMMDWLNYSADNMDTENCLITIKDFEDAVKVLQPLTKREGFLTIPDVSWNDIGSLHDIRDELRLAILAPVKFSEIMIRLGLTAPSGVLLFGPPGCGKTLIAKAIANEAGINFISVKGPELLKMYVGESERAVRDCFQRARNAAPCVIFFDEFDSLCPKRSDAHEGGSGIRVVNQLLTEMDGVEERKGIYIMAATNRPDIIDPAIMRPGRLDIILYVGMPNANDRCDILRAATKNRKRPVLSDDVDFIALSKKTECFTGADISGLVRKAAMIALKESIDNQNDIKTVHIAMQHFLQALEITRPSISQQNRKMYERMRLKYAAPRLAAEMKLPAESVSGSDLSD